MRKLILASIMDEAALGAVARLSGKPTRGMRVAYFATASIPEWEGLPWLELDKRRWLDAGCDVRFEDMRGHDEASLGALFAWADAVYCSGGNTFFLLREIRRSWFDRALRSFLERGGVYAGSSAGAIVATPEIGPVRLADDPSAAPGLPSTAGLALVEFAVCPHYRPDDPAEESIAAEYRGLGYETILLPDGAHVCADGGSRTVFLP